MFHVGCFPPLPLGEGWGEGKICPRRPAMVRRHGVMPLTRSPCAESAGEADLKVNGITADRKYLLEDSQVKCG
jgi:hypothetical protein